jgi:signal transduction histidine kinase
MRGRVVRSVRVRIALVAALVVAVVLTVAGVAIVAEQRRQLLQNVDDTLEQRTDQLITQLDSAGGASLSLAQGDSEDRLAQVVTPQGEVLAATANLSGLGPVAPAPESRGQELRNVSGLPIEDDTFRMLSRRVETPSGERVIHVAENIDDIGDSTRILTSTLLLGIPAVVALLAATVWWLVGRTLRPVEAIRTEVAGIGATELDRRVPTPGTGDEIDRLAETMNEMLDRLEESTRRQQRFVADASHELRSPLTRIRTELEVDLAHPGTAEPTVTHRSVLEEVTALQRLVEDLLELARSDAGAAPTRTEPVDLDDIVHREVRRLRAADHVSVDMSGVSAAHVRGDPDQLTRAVRNLLANAARHAHGLVTVTLSENAEAAVLTVDDDGPGIPAHRRQQVFERFARLDPARAAGSGGTGLGLAITREILRHHRGTITVGDSDRGGARFTVTLPTGPVM